MRRLQLVVLGLIAVAVIAIGGREVSADQAPAPSASPYLVVISNNAFSPSSLTVPVGSTVTWKNQDPYAHTVTMQGKNGFDSGNLDGGKTFSYTFTTAGTFNYICAIHPSMTGSIVVAKASM